jgi:excisionase family DNA binding protein
MSSSGVGVESRTHSGGQKDTLARSADSANPLLFTIEGAARRLNIGETLLREHLGEFGVVRIGRRVLIPASELERWVEAHTEQPQAVLVAVVGRRTV